MKAVSEVTSELVEIVKKIKNLQNDQHCEERAWEYAYRLFRGVQEKGAVLMMGDGDVYVMDVKKLDADEIRFWV